MKVKHDGRVVLSKHEYSRFRGGIIEYQYWRCYLCRNEFTYLEAHHQGEKGLGGSRHSDVPWFDVHPWDVVMRKGLVYGLGQDCHRKQDRKVLHWKKESA